MCLEARAGFSPVLLSFTKPLVGTVNSPLLILLDSTRYYFLPRLIHGLTVGISSGTYLHNTFPKSKFRLAFACPTYQIR